MFDFLFSQYKDYSTLFLVLEIVAVAFGIISVFYAKKNNILVFPTGIISTAIFIYLLYNWELLGDMLVNIYYTVFSIYGWFAWSKNKNGDALQVSSLTKKDYVFTVSLFTISIIIVALLYTYCNKFTSVVAYLDTFTTALFAVGMGLMARRKIENWLVWIVANLISVPLYFYKGYTFTSLQYLIFTIIALYGYLEWRTILQHQIKK